MNERYQAGSLPRAVNVLAEKPPSRQEQPSIIYQEEEDSVEVVLPQKFVDKREKPDCVPMLRIAEKDEMEVGQATHMRSQSLIQSSEAPHSFLASSRKSPTFGESSHASSSLSEVISDVSLAPSQQLQSPTTSTTLPKQVQFLSPVKKSAGKPTLLRPLHEKSAQLSSALPAVSSQGQHIRFPSEASTVKFTDLSTYTCKASVRYMESIQREERLGGGFVINGFYVKGKIEVQTKLQGVCYAATREEETFLVCEHRKRDLRRLLVKQKQTALDAIQQQIDVLSQCVHPNITALAAVIESPQKDPLYLVLRVEYASSLSALLPLTERAAWDVFRQMLNAVEYLHESLNLIHGDLRPDSFLVDTAGEVKLCWVYSCMRKTSDSDTGKDLFALVAILFLLLFSKSGDEDDYFDELLSILKAERIAIPSTCSDPLRAFLTLALAQREQLSLDCLRNDPWVRDGL